MMTQPMTLYEIASAMSETDDAQVGYPKLVKFLFNSFWNHYKYNGTPYSKEYAYNIAYFLIYNFMNREVCSKNLNVFRSKLLNEVVNMNKNKDFYNILTGLAEASVDLKRQLDTTDAFTSAKDGTTTNNLTDTSNSSQTSNNTTEGTLKNTGSSNNYQNTTGSTSAHGTVDTTTEGSGSTTTDNTGSASSTNKSTNSSTSSSSNENSSTNTTRSVLTDYPQSSIDSTTPAIGDWTYASGARDEKGSTSGTSTDTTTASSNTSDEGSSSTTTHNKASSTTKGTTKQVSDSTTATTGHTDGGNSTTTDQSTTGKDDTTTTAEVTDTHTGTVQQVSNTDDNRTIATTEVWSGLTNLDKNDAQLRLYDTYGTFYSALLQNFEKCFISVYVDPDRDGWLDPTIDLLSEWEDA